MQQLPPSGVNITRQEWTILSLIEWSANHLTGLGFDEARLHVELLLAQVLGFSRIQLYTNFDRPLTPEEMSRFKGLFKRRLAHEPLQYVLGETEFMGLPFAVTPAVLIPRPETEQLVENAIAAVQTIGKEKIRVLDIGTGSGNIAVSLAKMVPQATVVSVDVSEAALNVARSNAEHNGIVSVEFVIADVFADPFLDEEFDLIISNPPYVSAQEFDALEPEVKDFEPQIATTDGGDGFRFIRRICTLAARRLADGGMLFLEFAYNQGTESKNIAEQAGLQNVIVIPDYAGHPRILSARK